MMNDTMKGALIGGGAAILGGLVSGGYQPFMNWWNRPSLEIMVQNKHSPPNVTEASWKENDDLVEKIFARISVSNTGRSPALNCRVFLIKVDEVISGTAVNPRNVWESAQVPWAGHTFEGKNLPRGLTVFADLTRFDKSGPGWEFTEILPIATLDELREHRGTYQFGVVATSDNARPKYATISVDYPGDWHKVRIWKDK